MKRRNGDFNDKRCITAAGCPPEVAARVRYAGSPDHKRAPGDFGLTPPASPRRGASLCDGVVDRKADAQRLLCEGAKNGLVSEQKRNGWPQNIWSVTDAGFPLEAQLENQEAGTYHGYPMPMTDPFREEVLKAWKKPR
jgi:hypothetical protein